MADVPGRCELGIGEINCAAIAAALDRLDYPGVIALEGWASADPPGARTVLRRVHRATARGAAGGQ